MRADHRKLVGEAPAVVGMITASLQSGGSFDSAARRVAEEGPELSSRLFSEAVRRTDIRMCQSIRSSISGMMDSLPTEASGYRQAVSLCMTASEAAGREEMENMLAEASDTALDAVRRMGEAYSASLMFPCMAIFSIGIMVPMILMSLLPMMGAGGMFGSGGLDPGVVMLITLVVIPAGILMLTLDMRSKNPFGSYPLPPDAPRLCLPLVLSLPICAAYSMAVGGDLAVIVSAIPACILAMMLAYARYTQERRMSGCDDAVRDSVYEMGSRMSSGINFEAASVGALRGRAGCSGIAESLDIEFRLGKGDGGTAVSRAMSGLSAEACASIAGIERCSRVDLHDAGRLAISLGRQFQNRKSTMAALETSMKSMTDMMTGTAMVFAPLILGLSLSMMAPLSDVSGVEVMDGAWWVMECYLVELCALIAMLTSSLGRDSGFVTGLWRFCLMCPVSLIVFLIASSISL